ncbi:DUF2498 family protein [Salmonella enterica subsp. enterica]|nr:DUF2498 family protein [Salmonella enterica subsp. enterica]
MAPGKHEDTIAGAATGVTQRNGVLVFSGDYFRARVTDLEAPRCLTCLNTAHVLSEKYHPRINPCRMVESPSRQ